MGHPRPTQERYEKWNEAVASVVFTTAAAGRPVYLDLEDDVLVAIRDIAEPDALDPAQALVAAVRGTLRLNDGAGPIFGWHLYRLGRWRQGPMLDPPPTLALLAVLSLAAENMRDGDGQAANNFYGRLAQLLSLDEQQIAWFIHAYRNRLQNDPVSEMLWGSLNDWLDRLEGNRGNPSAYAVTHAHIGLPLSQALVRRTDRDKFAELFALYGLAPHSSLPGAEIAELMAEWISRVPCPVSNSLERLWKSDSGARDRIIDVVRQTLEAWDGLSANGAAGVAPGSRQVDSVRVKALLQRRFPARRLEIDLIVAAPSGASAESVTVIGLDGEPIGSLDLIPAASGWLTLADPTEIDAGSFLRGETRLRRDGQQLTLRRRPRRLIPLRRDDLVQAFIECERVSLGEDALLLARNEIADRVAAALLKVARPGFVRDDSISGLPEGWTLFDGVQILSSIPIEVMRSQLVDLNVIQPLASSQVVLQGGMRLPGNIRKWSSFLAPELRVTSDSGSALSASITCVRPLSVPTPPDLFCSSDQPVLIWDLSEAHLPDGDYEITVVEHGISIGRPDILRLRSADTPAVVLPDDPRPLAHDRNAQSFALLAERSGEPTAFRCIPQAEASLDNRGDGPIPVPKWYLARKSKPVQARNRVRVCLPAPEQGSCMMTGQHYMLVETATGRESTVEGVCKACGLVKRYPTKARHKRAPRKGPSNPAPRVTVSELEDVRAPPSIDWTLGFDALCHLGSGPVSALERVALQMEPASLFADVFARRLEVLGHIELGRDPRSLAPKWWEVVEPMLAGLPDGHLSLLGFRSERMLVAVEDAAWGMKAEYTVNRAVDGPPLIQVESSEPMVVAGLIRSIEAATEKVVRFVPNAAEALTACLPPLSTALSCLPTTSLISARSIERWDPLTARFESVGDSGSPGAYRLKGFTRSYIYRRPQDLGAMSALVGDARLVKFAAALDVGLPLVGYDQAARVLYVPLGADLPGLYGRAAVLASGHPPLENTNEHLLEYRSVPSHVAARLCHLLMS